VLGQILLIAAFILTLLAGVGLTQPRPYVHLGWLGVSLWILTILLMRWHL